MEGYYLTLRDQKFNQKYDTWLDSMIFPFDLLPELFNVWLDKAVKEHTRFTLQCSWQTYVNILTKDITDFSYLDIINACNAIQFCSPKVFDCQEYEYVNLQSDIQKVAAKFDQLVKDKRAEIDSEVTKEVQAIYEADRRKANIRNSLTKK